MIIYQNGTIRLYRRFNNYGSYLIPIPYLFGAQANAGADVNLSELMDENDCSSLGGLWFSQSVPGLLWIQTDASFYLDATNCMMLAALPPLPH